MEESILSKNQKAMKFLNKGKKQESITLLREAESQLFDEHNKDKQNSKINRLIGITLNNLGCYFQKDEKPQVALKYLQKALEIESISQYDFSTLSGTHLNICAIFSSLGKHQEAIKHAKSALYFVQKAKQQILSSQETQENFNSQNESTILLQKLKTQIIDLAVSLQKSSYNIYTTEIISYYNLGIEYQYLRDYKKSLHMLKAGYNIAFNHLGVQNPLCIKMDESVKIGEQLLNKMLAKSQKRFYRNSFIGLLTNQSDLKISNNSFLAGKNDNTTNDGIYLNDHFKLVDEFHQIENNLPSSRKRSTSNNLNKSYRPKMDLKLPNLNYSTLENQSEIESPYFSKIQQPQSQQKENIQQYLEDKNINDKKQIDVGIQKINQPTLKTLETKSDNETLNEHNKYWRANSFVNISQEKHQQLISQIFQNMEMRNNQNLIGETQEDWKENIKKQYLQRGENINSQTHQKNNINNKYQRSLSTNPRSKQLNSNQTSTLEPISMNKLVTQNHTNYQKTPKNKQQYEQSIIAQLEELYEKKNIEHIRTKLNSYQAHTKAKNLNLQNSIIQSPTHIQQKPSTTKRIRFQKQLPSNNISRRIKTDFQIIQEENDQISDYKHFKQ